MKKYSVILTPLEYMKFSLLWTYLIIIKVGDHNKQLTGHALWSAFWNEHVLRPATPTEVELF
jgi:hypothetical protein